jgi:hypothetical protein
VSASASDETLNDIQWLLKTNFVPKTRPFINRFLMLFQAVLQAKVHGTFGLLPSSSKAKAQASLLEPFWPKLCTVEINRTNIASFVTAEKL